VIPRDFITTWRKTAPWVQDALVEQDLVISRALVDIYSRPQLASALAFRGGTALYKLYMPPARYSEDIDLVQTNAGAIGPVIDELRSALAWLGEPGRKQNEGRVTLTFKFNSEDAPPLPLKLKVEINTREHFSVHGYAAVDFDVDSRWFKGSARIRTFTLDELLATKLRALYQRKKGRDLLDLDLALQRKDVHPDRIAAAFQKYMAHEGHPITRAMFEKNLAEKLDDERFTADLGPLLAAGFAWQPDSAAQRVSELIAQLPGDPWKRPPPRAKKATRRSPRR
jgi:predicted nucleotidyltransferase component of viral defense system